MKKLFKDNKGQAFNALSGLAIGLLGFTLAVVIMMLIISQGLTQIGNVEGVTCTGNDSTVANGGGTSKACNATKTLQSAAADLPDWAPLIVIVGVGLVLFSMIAGFLFLRQRN